jgi:hypothetical protein
MRGTVLRKTTTSSTITTGIWQRKANRFSTPTTTTPPPVPFLLQQRTTTSTTTHFLDLHLWKMPLVAVCFASAKKKRI